MSTSSERIRSKYFGLRIVNKYNFKFSVLTEKKISFNDYDVFFTTLMNTKSRFEIFFNQDKRVMYLLNNLMTRCTIGNFTKILENKLKSRNFFQDPEFCLTYIFIHCLFSQLHYYFHQLDTTYLQKLPTMQFR